MSNGFARCRVCPKREGSSVSPTFRTHLGRAKGNLATLSVLDSFEIRNSTWNSPWQRGL